MVIPGASSVPGVGREPASTASSSRSITPPSRVSGASTSESPSVCTRATRFPGISRTMRRISDLATKRRDGGASIAAIESEESRRKTTSTPLRSTFCSPDPQRGRARANEAPSTATASVATARVSRRGA